MAKSPSGSPTDLSSPASDSPQKSKSPRFKSCFWGRCEKTELEECESLMKWVEKGRVERDAGGFVQLKGGDRLPDTYPYNRGPLKSRFEKYYKDHPITGTKDVKSEDLSQQILPPSDSTPILPPTQEQPILSPPKPQQQLRRSSRERVPTRRYIEEMDSANCDPVSIVFACIVEDPWTFGMLVENDDWLPRNFSHAMTRPDLWLGLMTTEFNTLTERDRWELVSLPDGANLMGGKWVFALKRDTSGKLSKRKVRWVAQGFTQVFGLD
jgi:hypothetical protein